MASVLAIVSRKVFEAEARVAGRVVGLGEVWPTDRYLSKVAGLRPLEAGGDLYLCTVRPPDERLWLVAVLRGPRFDGERWTSPANSTAVTDVSALIPKLRFATGTGVTAEPGKLGMSLQTPRALTAADVDLFAALAGGREGGESSAVETRPKAKAGANAKAKAGAKDETPAPLAELRSRLAPKVAEPLFAAWSRAATAPTAAAKQTKETAKALGLTAEALMVLELGADTLLAADKADQAASLFAAARTLEKKLGKAAPARTAEATLALYARYAASGAVESRSLTALATALTKVKGEVLDSYAALVGAWAAAGGVLEVGLVDAVEKLAKSHKADPEEALAAVLAVLLPAFDKQAGAEAELWPRLEAALTRALALAPGHADKVLDLWPRARPASAWRGLLDTVGGPALLAKAGAERVAAWLEAACAWRAPVDAEHLAWLARWSHALAKKVERPLVLPTEPDPELVEILLSAGLELDTNEVEIRANAWPTFLWEKRPDGPYAGLVRVEAHPHFGPLLRGSIRASLESRAFEPKWTRLASFPQLARELVAWVEELARDGTVAAWDLWLPAFTKAFTAATFAQVPGLKEALAKADLALALRNTMKHGVMDEWHWPLQEKVSELLGRDADQYDTDGPFPYWTTWDEVSHRVIVIGPEGVVYDGVYHPPEGAKGVRCLRWVPGARPGEGDVLVQVHPGSQTVTSWVSDPKTAKPSTYLQTWSLACLPEGGGISEGGPALRVGDTDLTSWHRPLMDFAWDGERFWRIERQEKIEAFDPMTGQATGEPPPAFFAALPRGKKLDLGASALMALPESITASPLGQSGKLYGWRAWGEDGRQGGDHIDGRCFEGRIRSPHTERESAHGLFRFPEREADCPLVESGGDVGLWTSDGRFPLVPPRHANWYLYWYGAPQWLPRSHWHHLVPASPAASRALREATLSQAEAMMAAARGGTMEPGDMTKSVIVSGGVSAIVSGHGREDPPERLPLVVAALEACGLGAAMPPRLKLGLGHIATLAAGLEDKLRALRELAAQAPVETARSGRPDDAFGALRRLFEGSGPGGAMCFEDQVRAVDLAFRQALSPGDSTPAREAAVVHVPESGLPWLRALAQTRSLAWRVLALGTPEDEREQLAATLEVFAGTRMLAEPQKFRVFKATFSGWPARGMGHQAGQKVLTWNGGKNRYFVTLRHFDGNKNLVGFEVLECAEGGVFLDPPGLTEIAWQVPLAGRALSATDASRVLALLAERGPFGHHAGAARRVSDKTGLLYPSASLLFAAAWQPWEPTAAVRAALGLKVAEAELGRDELDVSWHEAYQRAFPSGAPERLYAPETPGPDGPPVAEALADAVLGLVGKRTPLPVAMVELMQEELRGKRPYHMDVRVLEDPDRWRFLTSDIDWVVRPWNGFKSNLSWMVGWIPPGWPKHAGMPEGEVSPRVDVAFSGWVLRHFLAYLAWAQHSLPRGDTLRLGAAKMAEHIAKRLENPRLLLLAGAIDLSTEPDPARLSSAFEELLGRFDGPRYVASDGLSSASGHDRGDLVVTWPEDTKNSLFFAFRPAALRDPQALMRLAEDLGFGEAFRPRRSGCTCGLNFGRHKVVDFTDLASFVTWSRPGFQRLVGTLAAPGEGYDADPNVSAPGVVAAMVAEDGLTPDEATLCLQLRALPEPTLERVRRWNGWDRKRYDAAARGLVAKGLATEARHDRTKRTLFAPGPVTQLAAPAVPMESSKLELHGLEVDDAGKARAPFGAVLPLLPLAELFEAVR